ncbi:MULTISPECIES: DUF6431 domain-containing protein [Catenibacterium]
MIIIKLPIKIKYISQIQYNKIISSLNFNNLQCPNCHSNGLIIHAYYERHVDIFDRNHTIRILRLKCPSCNSTHAVLIEDMVPYSVVSFNIIVDILKNNDFLTSSHSSFLKNKYRSLIFDYALFCKLNVRHNPFSFFQLTT